MSPGSRFTVSDCGIDGQRPALRPVLVVIDDAVHMERLDSSEEFADLQPAHIGDRPRIG